MFRKSELVQDCVLTKFSLKTHLDEMIWIQSFKFPLRILSPRFSIPSTQSKNFLRHITHPSRKLCVQLEYIVLNFMWSYFLKGQRRHCSNTLATWLPLRTWRTQTYNEDINLPDYTGCMVVVNTELAKSTDAYSGSGF